MISITVHLDSSGLDAITAGLARSEGTSPPGPIRDMYKTWGDRTQRFNEERFDRFSIGGGDWSPLALSTIRARKAPSRAAKQSVFNARFGGRGPDSIGARSSLARDTARGGLIIGAGRTVSILKDTGVLRAALKIGAPGSTFEFIPGGFEYGVAGKQPHGKNKGGSGGAALAATVAVMTRAGKAIGRGGSIPVPKKKGAGRTPTIGEIAGFHQTGGPKLPKREVIVVPDQIVVDAMAGDAITAVLKLAGTG